MRKEKREINAVRAENCCKITLNMDLKQESNTLIAKALFFFRIVRNYKLSDLVKGIDSRILYVLDTIFSRF